MNVRTDLTAVIKIYVAKIVPVNQPNTASCALVAMDIVRSSFAKSVLPVFGRLMFVMDAIKSVNAAL